MKTFQPRILQEQIFARPEGQAVPGRNARADGPETERKFKASAHRHCVLKRVALALFLQAAWAIQTAPAQTSNRFDLQLGGSVQTVAQQTDGKLVIGGFFSSVAGVSRTNLARLNPDGSLDEKFRADTDGEVDWVGILEDGSIVVSGWFTSLGGHSHYFLGKLDKEGRVDDTFSPPLAFQMPMYGVVLAQLAVQSALDADERILIAGDALASVVEIQRFGADGTADDGFDQSLDGSLVSMWPAPGNKLVLAGQINLPGKSRQSMVRLGTNGLADAEYQLDQYRVPLCLVQLRNGEFLMATSDSLVKLQSDGRIDPGFEPGIQGEVYSLTLQADGRLLAGGDSQLYRLQADGTWVTNFDLGFAGRLLPHAFVLGDGSLLITSSGSDWLPHLSLVPNDQSASATLSWSGSTATWLRGGAAPEVWRTAFDYSTNGVDWIRFGVGARISGGWQVDGLPPGFHGSLRARGYVGKSTGGGGDWYVESFAGKPVITTPPESVAIAASGTATFRVVGGGGEPLSLQWLKDGVRLPEVSRISGAQTTTLVVRDCFKADEGAYSLVLSNAYGCTTSSVARLLVSDPAILQSPTGFHGNEGETATLQVKAAGTGHLSYQWRKNGVPLSRATAATLELPHLRASDAGDYSVRVSGPYGSATSTVAEIEVNVIHDDPSFETNAFGWISALAFQGNGKLVCGGDMWATDGNAFASRTARLNADGSLDAGFQGAVDNAVICLLIQPDGKVLYGGGFYYTFGREFGRLEPDGSPDTAFNPQIGEDLVLALALQEDGKVLMAGEFEGTSVFVGNANLARLNQDGTVDTTFQPALDGRVSGMAVQADGKIVVGGQFTYAGETKRRGIARFNLDGTLDESFNPGVSGYIEALAIQPDGRILVGGWITELAGQPCANLGRLNPDGSLDTSLAAVIDNFVLSIVLQTDGQILIAGCFSNVAGEPRIGIARLNSGGVVDHEFNPGATRTGNCVAIQPDGKILVGQSFYSFTEPNVWPGTLCRLANNQAALQSLFITNSTVTWLRQGSCPEVNFVWFEQSTNGQTWAALGPGQRIPGGWRLSGLASPRTGLLRARGVTSGGIQNGSSGMVEQLLGDLELLFASGSRTINAGAPASFTVAAQGSEPMVYQWQKNGVALVDGGNVHGAESSQLNLSSCLKRDEGAYQVVIRNAFGSVTSAVATLSVVDPFIVAHPQGQRREVGQSAFLQTTAMGTPPLAYQWLRDGQPVARATRDSLKFAGLQAREAGIYSVAVSNAYGCLTSHTAELIVNRTRLDTNFAPFTSASWLAPLAIQLDGKILVTGPLETSGTAYPGELLRLNSDGTLDSGFAADISDVTAALAVQDNGKLIWAGEGGGLARLNPNGSVDPSFTTDLNGRIITLTLQADGKLLVGGTFDRLGSFSCTNIARLNRDGSVDPEFHAAIDGWVYSLALQADGKILAGGSFSTVDGAPRTNLARFYPDGTLEAGFNPLIDGEVFALAVQADGKILAGGSFSMVNQQARAKLARLNADGSLDSAFDAPANGSVSSLALQTDGKILVGGGFESIAGQPRTNLACLKSDGRLDSTFYPDGVDPFDAVLNPDGSMILADASGNAAGGQLLYRLRPSEPAVHRLLLTDTNITWVRSGGGPEVSQVTFDYSGDGSNWTNLGSGWRIPGGWQLNGLAGLRPGTVRARGYVAGRGYDGDTWLLEDLQGALAISVQPADSMVDYLSTAQFEVLAGGGDPLRYQWFHDGAPLSDGPRIHGAKARELSLNGVTSEDLGGYCVVIQSGMSSVTSTVAGLNFRGPVITEAPAWLSVVYGTNVSLTVRATGEPPLSYQWFKSAGWCTNGVPLVNGTASNLELPAVTGADAGSYFVMVSNRHGAVSTSPVQVSVADPYLLESPRDVSANVGMSARFRVSAIGSPPLSFSWGKLPWSSVRLADRSTLALTNIQPADLGTYYVVITNAYGWVNAQAILLVNTVNVDPGFSAETDGDISALAIQPDGKILVGGAFGLLNGQPCHGLGRLNVDGSLDTGFRGHLEGSVSAIVIADDDKILVGGSVSDARESAPTGLIRLNADGSRDPGFNPQVTGTVAALALDDNERILVGGNFSEVGGLTFTNLARVNTDGRVDAGFCPAGQDTVNAIKIYSSGEILVARPSDLESLGQDGELEWLLYASSYYGGAITWPVTTVALEADENILAGTDLFYSCEEFPPFCPGPDGLIRLTNLYARYQLAQGTGRDVYSLAIQSDGQILVGGDFTTIAGHPGSRLGRLDVAGHQDPTWMPTLDGFVTAVAQQADGKVLVGGRFDNIGGMGRLNLARLANTAPAVQTLSYDGSTVTWQRSGTGPEVWHARFDYSVDGITWVKLGLGSRVAGGWQLTHAVPPEARSLRARGQTSGGQNNSSSGLVESVLRLGAPAPPLVHLGSAILPVGGHLCLPLTVDPAGTYTNLTISVSLPDGRFTNPSATTPTSLTHTAATTGRVGSTQFLLNLSASDGEVLTGQVADLCFDLVSGLDSAVLGLTVSAAFATGVDGTTVHSFANGSGRVVAVGNSPLLEYVTEPGGGRSLMVYGPPQGGYRIETTTRLGGSSWTELVSNLNLTNLVSKVPLTDSPSPQRFYRVVKSAVGPPPTQP